MINDTRPTNLADALEEVVAFLSACDVIFAQLGDAGIKITSGDGEVLLDFNDLVGPDDDNDSVQRDIRETVRRIRALEGEVGFSVQGLWPEEQA